MLKAQISVEHTVILLIVLALIIPIIGELNSNSSDISGRAYDQIIDNQVNIIIDAVERAPLLGENSQQSVIVNLPNNFVNATVIENQTFLVTMESGNQLDQYIYSFKYNINYDGVSSTLAPGRHKFIVKGFQNGVCLTKDGGCGVICGNNKVEGTEVCDTSEIPSTCIGEGFTGGQLLCNDDCDGFITTFCTS
jgi:hypothetical protein